MDDSGMEDSRVQLILLLQNHFRNRAYIEGAEIGVHHGLTSTRLLRELPALHLYMIDLWCVDEKYALTMMAHGGDVWLDPIKAKRWCVFAQDKTKFAASRRTIMRGRSEEWADLFGNEALDFVFIDGDHTKEGVLSDLRAWHRIVKPGGLVIGHDYEHPEKEWAVKKAVEIFNSEEQEGMLSINVGRGFVWWYVKN